MKKENAKSDTMKYGYILCYLFLLGVVIFLSFYRLDAKYVDPWDEARHGVNAYEMANGGSLVQNTYLRQADYYNLKPPLSMWCIMLSMKLFGNTVFALRFYSAACYVLLTTAAGLFARRHGRLESLLVMAFLAVNITPFQAHMIRAGDADSLYVLLFTLAMFAMMRVKDDVRFVYACGLLFSLAFLTKSYHAGIIMAIGGLYLLLTGDLLRMKIRNWCGFLASALLPVALWALWRMQIDGMTFLRAMWETDVLGRTDGTLQNNIAPFSYYFSYYFGAASGKVTIYLCALVVCLIGCFLFGERLRWENRRQYLGYLLWFGVTMLAFSLVKNKLLWYVYPALIPLLMAAGILLARIIKHRECPAFLRIMLAAASAFAFCYFVRAEVTVIRQQGGNEFQELIADAARESGLTGCEVFVEYDTENAVWNQQDVFVAEISGDYSCQNGGMLSLLARSTYRGEEGLLFVAKEVYEADKAIYEEQELLMQSEHYRVYQIRY